MRQRRFDIRLTGAVFAAYCFHDNRGATDCRNEAELAKESQ